VCLLPQVQETIMLIKCSQLSIWNILPEFLQSHVQKIQNSDSCTENNMKSNSMEQSPSWEANTHSARQETFMEPKPSFPRSEEPNNGPYPEPDESSPQLLTPFLWCILVLSSHLHLLLPSGLSPPCSLTEILYIFLISPMHITCPNHFIFLDLKSNCL